MGLATVKDYNHRIQESRQERLSKVSQRKLGVSAGHVLLNIPFAVI